MGFRMRRSINLGGGFRVNLSKSGVGYSWGVPGYRITRTAKGKLRKTYSIPGTGLSYVEELSNKSNRQNSNHYSTPVTQEPIMKDIESADIENYQPAEYRDFIDSIHRIISINKIANFLCYSVIFIPFGIFLKIFILYKGKIKLDYELDDYYIQKHKNVVTAFKELKKSSALWQIIQHGDVINRKINAGATSLVNRKTFKIINDKPFYLTTNTEIIQVKLNRQTLIFMPDKILVIKGSKIGAVPYDDINIDVTSTQFIESSIIPKDAEIIDYTWEKVNKNGTPDKRYNNNRQLPVCRYGEIYIYSNSGLNIILQCSNLQNTYKFEELIFIIN